MDIQKMLNVMSNAARTTRSDYHLTLGAAIAALEKANPSASVRFDSGGSPGEPQSYRGYYSDLSFEPSNNAITAAEFLAVCRGALGNTYEGYKGGDFLMDTKTPLWAASYGHCGPAIVSVVAAGNELVLVTKEIED